MPYLSGTELIEQAQTMYKKKEVAPGEQPLFVIHSAVKDEAVTAKLNKLGVNTFLDKPATAKDLGELLVKTGFVMRNELGEEAQLVKVPSQASLKSEETCKFGNSMMSAD